MPGVLQIIVKLDARYVTNHRKLNASTNNSKTGKLANVQCVKNHSKTGCLVHWYSMLEIISKQKAR